MTKNLPCPPKVCVSNDALTGILYMQSFNYMGLKTILITKIKVLINVQIHILSQLVYIFNTINSVHRIYVAIEQLVRSKNFPISLLQLATLFACDTV